MRKALSEKFTKTYACSKMMRLPPARRVEIFMKSENGSRISDLVAEIAEKDGLKISADSLGSWLARMRVRWRMERTADVIKDVIECARNMNGGEIDVVVEAMVRQKLFDMIAEDAAPDAIADLFRCVLSARKQSVEERRVALLEKKAAAFDRAKEAAQNAALTPEQRAKKIEALLLG